MSEENTTREPIGSLSIVLYEDDFDVDIAMPAELAVFYLNLVNNMVLGELSGSLVNNAADE